MTERGILFSGAMVRALLAGTKTQTRRVLRDQPTTEPLPRDEWSDRGPCPPHLFPFRRADRERAHYGFRCPYGVPGDRLWVRETWRPWNGAASAIHGVSAWSEIDYQADSSRRRIDVADEQVRCNRPGDTWWPSIHMPRWASRITLEVTEVRVQRLQDISEEDARAEGITPRSGHMWKAPGETEFVPYPARAEFAALWDSINGDRAPWSSNPWVWAVSFRRVQP